MFVAFEISLFVTNSVDQESKGKTTKYGTIPLFGDEYG
jgi:hypothetical protein